MALLSWYSSSTDQTSSSSSSHSIVRPRKTASGNPCKHLSAIQRSNQKLWPFWADTQGCRPDILGTEQWFHSLPKKNSLWKPCKILSAIQQSDQTLLTFLSQYSILADKTYPSPSSHSIATPRKTPSRNPSKNLTAIQRSDQKLWLF